MATEIEIIEFKVCAMHISIGFYKDGKPDIILVPIEAMEIWAKENSRMKVLSPVYEGGNVVDHDEMPIGFDTYLSILDKEEIKHFIQDGY